MSAHISENLPRLLTGEATREETLTAAAHLRGCPDCQHELVSAVVAHASLTSANRFAPGLVAPRARHDRDASLDDTDGGGGADETPLPDLSSVFAEVRGEATRPAPPAHGPRRRWLVTAAAAVVLAVGGGVAAAELTGPGPAPHSAAQSVTLHPVGDVRVSATATISGGSMRIDATALPTLDASRQYEVWLVAANGTQLRPLGYVGADRTATLPVPRRVMSRYDDIAISIQKTDQVRFSGDMVVRGHYA